jgi:hypothetical protein
MESKAEKPASKPKRMASVPLEDLQASGRGKRAKTPAKTAAGPGIQDVTSQITEVEPISEELQSKTPSTVRCSSPGPSKKNFVDKGNAPYPPPAPAGQKLLGLNQGLPPRPPSNKKSDVQKVKKGMLAGKGAGLPAKLPGSESPANLTTLCEGMDPIYHKPVNWGIPVTKAEKVPRKPVFRKLQPELKTLVIDGEVFEPPPKIPDDLFQVS